MNLCPVVASGLAGALSGALLVALPGCPPPQPTPPPSTTTTTTAPTTTTTSSTTSSTTTTTTTLTPAAGCPLTLADVNSFRPQVKAHGGQLLDETTYACGPRVLAALEGCGRSCCPLDANKPGPNGACAVTLYGPPEFTSDVLLLAVQENPWTVKVRERSGTLNVGPSVPAALAVPGASVSLQAAATVPACHADADNVCALDP